MSRTLIFLSFLSSIAFCAPVDTLGDTAEATPAASEVSPVPVHPSVVPVKTSVFDTPVASSLRPGTWGLGLRPFGTTTSLLAYRAITPRWESALRLSWSDIKTDQQTPASLSSNTYQYQYQSIDSNADNRSSNTSSSGTISSVTDTRTITAVWEAQYDLPTGHGVDFKAGFGPAFTWSWNDASQTSNLVDQTGAALGPIVSTSGSWTATGGLRGTLGVRWWFVPQRLALAGEFEGGGSIGYTAAHSNATTATVQTLTGPTTAPLYNYSYTTSGQTSSHSNTWAYSTTSYTCSVGVDAYF
jgi:hypothetical protein